MEGTPPLKMPGIQAPIYRYVQHFVKDTATMLGDFRKYTGRDK